MNGDDFGTRWRWPISERGMVWLIAIGACIVFWLYIATAFWIGFHNYG